jgi:hypothetical protein
MSFATKLLMFMNPSVAAVYDDVISQRLRTNVDPALQNMYVSTGLASSTRRQRQCDTYRDWCMWCREQADAINSGKIKWVDWNGDEHQWRAVDVERAFFALGRSPKLQLRGAPNAYS